MMAMTTSNSIKVKAAAIGDLADSRPLDFLEGKMAMIESILPEIYRVKLSLRSQLMQEPSLGSANSCQRRIVFAPVNQRHRYFTGSVTRPRNSMPPECVSRMRKMNGWSARNTTGFPGRMAIGLIATPVAAAASVPSSVSSRNALWTSAGVGGMECFERAN
jgi:hypothetical protein